MQEFPEGTLRLRFAANHDKNFTDGSPIEHFGGAPAALAASAFVFTVGGYDSIRSVPMLYVVVVVAAATAAVWCPLI
jgi:hypothetical protein